MQSSGGIYWVFFAAIVVMTGWMFFQQSKQQKKRKQLQGDLHRGDKIFTVGGMIGTISDVKDNHVVMEIAKDVKIEVLKTAVGGKYQG